jgi:hypothetical protein
MHNSYNRFSTTPIWFLFSFILMGIALMIGWVINIFKLIGIAQATDPNYVMAAIRAIGIFVAPLGGILGLFV